MTVIKQYNPGSSQWEPVLVGAGVPAGGTVGQALVKASSVDYDTEWGAAAGGGLDQAAADLRYVNVDGDTMTDSLTIQGALQVDATIDAGTGINVSGGSLSVDAGNVIANSVISRVGHEMTAEGDFRAMADTWLEGNVFVDQASGVGEVYINTNLYIQGEYTPGQASTIEAHGGIKSSKVPTLDSHMANKLYVDNHINDTSAAHAATAISYAGSTNLAATTVEAALDELDAEKQPLDADLTTIAGLTATTGNIIQSVGSAWASQTPTQVKAALAIASTDVSGLGSLATKSAIGTADITDGVVSNTDLTTMAANTVKMNNTGATAAPQDVTVANLLTALGLSVPVTVAQGGSGRATATTAYGLLAAGTTATGVQQTVTPAASGFLKTTSATALPAWTAIAQADVTNLVNDLSNKQPLDSDLSAIAILAHATNSMIQSNGTAWIAATPTQVKTGLAITKTDVGLANVDNTSDANKAISTATQTALDNKQALDTDLTIIAGLVHAVGSVIQSNGASWAASTPAQVKTSLTLVKGDVGLGSVDNTSDVNKPVSTAQAAADLLKADKTTTISVTAPITGGGDLSANRTIGVNTFGTAQAGVVPQSGGGTANYLRADGSWTPPPGSGGITDGDKGEISVTAGVWSIDADVVTNAKLANMAANSFKGNNTGIVADPIDMSVTEAKALLAMSKSDVGLGNVDNTSDANKPVSTATTTALGLKVNKAGDTISGQLLINQDAVGPLDVTGRSYQVKVRESIPASGSGIGFYSSTATWWAHVSASATALALQTAATIPVKLSPGGTNGLDVAETLITSYRPIALPADPASALHAATKQYVDGLAAQATLDARYVNTNGDSMAGGLYLKECNLVFTHSSGSPYWGQLASTVSALQLNAPPSGTVEVRTASVARLTVADTLVTSTLPVVLPADPASALHAATKQYVDTQRDTRQPLDTDLTTIAGLTATTDNIIQSVGSAWASRTPAQVKTSLALDQVTNTSDANKPVSTAQATADGLRVLKAGDIMTGPLNLHGTTIVVKDTPGTTTRGTISGSAQGVSIDDLEVTSDFVCQGYADFNSGLGTSETISISSDDLMFTLAGGVEYGVYWYSSGNPQGRIVHNATRMDLKGDKPGGVMGVTVRNAANTLDLGLTLSETTVTAGVPITLPGVPTSSLHAATKQYVDDNAGGGGGTTTWTGTQAEFDALVTLDVDTFYYVTP